jgi:hypothetical protein
MQKLFLLLVCLFTTGCAYEAGYGYRYFTYPTTQLYYTSGYAPGYGPGYSPHYNHNPHYNPPPSIIVRPNNNQHGRLPPRWHH